MPLNETELDAFNRFAQAAARYRVTAAEHEKARSEYESAYAQFRMLAEKYAVKERG